MKKEFHIFIFIVILWRIKWLKRGSRMLNLFLRPISFSYSYRENNKDADSLYQNWPISGCYFMDCAQIKSDGHTQYLSRCLITIIKQYYFLFFWGSCSYIPASIHLKSRNIKFWEVSILVRCKLLWSFKMAKRNRGWQYFYVRIIFMVFLF